MRLSTALKTTNKYRIRDVGVLIQLDIPFRSRLFAYDINTQESMLRLEVRIVRLQDFLREQSSILNLIFGALLSSDKVVVFFFRARPPEQIVFVGFRLPWRFGLGTS